MNAGGSEIGKWAANAEFRENILHLLHAHSDSESGQVNRLTSDHDNRWKSCDWMDVMSTGGLFSSVPDRRSVPAYL